MNTLDIIILILLLIGGLNGLRQGFVKAFANLIGWILALIMGAKYASFLAPSMGVLSHDPVVQKIAAFAFIVLMIIVLTWIVTAILNLILKSMSLGPLNRLAGGAFGTLKGLLIVLVTMQGLTMGRKLSTLETVQIYSSFIALCAVSNRIIERCCQ